jgi:O-glycosyl hydrolase
MHHLGLLPALLLLGCQAVSQPEPVFARDAALTTEIANLANTNANRSVEPVSGQPFDQSLKVVIGKTSAETNATQLTINNQTPVSKGDVLVASLYLRGKASNGDPARIELMFEKNTAPWTKSVTQGFQSTDRWRKVAVAFASSETYAPGEAMLSLRLAFGPQTVEIGGLSLLNFKKSKTLEEAQVEASLQTPLGKIEIALDPAKTLQTMEGLGGNFCQPRYGQSEPMDAVGERVLKDLNVSIVRTGLPLNSWAPEPGKFSSDGPAGASFRALQRLSKLKVPIVVSIWEGPAWLVGGQPEQSGKVLAPNKYQTCVDLIAAYLLKAQKDFGVNVDYVSFNEPDIGINFKFGPSEMGTFIRLTGQTFQRLGLKTRFIVADTANGVNLYDYAKPLLQDPSLRNYLGPIGFHSWDSMSATTESYRRIAQLGREFGKPVWCLEAGHDAQLWQRESPWDTWENAISLAFSYARTANLSGASQIAYWTYQDNYPLVSKDGLQAYPAFDLVRQMEAVFAKGRKVIDLGNFPDAVVATATLGPQGDWRLLLVNRSGPGEVTFKNLPKGAKVTLVTSQAKAVGQKSTLNTTPTGTLTVTAPYRSVLVITLG